MSAFRSTIIPCMKTLTNIHTYTSPVSDGIQTRDPNIFGISLMGKRDGTT